MTDKPKKGELGYECEHGRLGRKCEICEAEETIARLTREIARQQDRIGELEGLVKEYIALVDKYDKIRSYASADEFADSLANEQIEAEETALEIETWNLIGPLQQRARTLLSPRTEAENG